MGSNYFPHFYVLKGMKTFIFFLITGLMVACSASDPEGTGKCYTLIERQCAMDPFNSYFTNVKTPEDKAAAIDLYLGANGINAEVKANPVSTDAVCQACICPSGFSYQLEVADRDTTKLNALNIYLIKRNCD